MYKPHILHECMHERRTELMTRLRLWGFDYYVLFLCFPPLSLSLCLSLLEQSKVSTYVIVHTNLHR